MVTLEPGDGGGQKDKTHGLRIGNEERQWERTQRQWRENRGRRVKVERKGGGRRAAW